MQTRKSLVQGVHLAWHPPALASTAAEPTSKAKQHGCMQQRWLVWADSVFLGGTMHTHQLDARFC